MAICFSGFEVNRGNEGERTECQWETPGPGATATCQQMANTLQMHSGVAGTVKRMDGSKNAKACLNNCFQENGCILQWIYKKKPKSYSVELSG